MALLSKYGETKGFHNPLHFSKISKNSPLTIELIGELSPIILAIIVSGGKIEMDATGLFKGEVNTLGSGLKSIFEAIIFFKEKIASSKPIPDELSHQEKKLLNEIKSLKKILQMDNINEQTRSALEFEIDLKLNELKNLNC